MGSVRRTLARLTVPFAASTLVAWGALGPPATAQDVPLERVHAMLPSSAASARVAGDWDGDGDLDLVGPGSPLTWQENVDHGRYARRPLSSGGYDRPLLAADLDGNDRMDLLSESYYIGIAAWANSGDQPFVTPPLLLTPSSVYPSSAGAAAGDLDGDGDVDVYAFLSGFGVPPDTLFFNDGSGAFPTQASLATTPGQTEAVALADFDGDGDLDALRGDQSEIELWSNDGLGSLALAAVQPPVPSGTRMGFTRVADLDADGRLDFLAGLTPHFYRNLGDARFVDEGEVIPQLASYRSAEFFLVDVTGDELPDVLGVPAQQGFAGLFRNTGRAGFEFDPSARLPKLTEIVADVDGDHDRDLIGSSDDLELWLNDGEGSFTNTRDPWESDLRTKKVVVGDLDGDRFLDVFSWEDLGRVRWPAVVFRNLANGTFVEQALPYVLSGFPDRTSLVDVDRDGDLDVYVLNWMSGSGVPTLLVNDRRAGFTETSGRFPGLAPTYTSEPMDLDLDGDPDLLAIGVSSTGQTSAVIQGYSWLNDGAGAFLDSGKVLPSKSYSTYYGGGDPLLGDIDGDSDPDALLLYVGLLWSNDGTGGFSDISSRLNGNPVLSEGAFADMDRDGDLDLVSSYTFCIDENCHGQGQVLLNDGLGAFSKGQGYWDSFDPYRGQGEFSVADVDADGDVDVLSSNCMFWENDGTGRLENESYELSYCTSRSGGYYGTYYEELAIEDLDRDGDLDLWYPGLPRPVMNTTRHVSWRSYPRAGKPLTMEVSGPAGTPFQLFSSPRFTEPQPSDFGYLRLATRGARLVATGTLDAEGKAAVTLGVPSDLALPESTLYWQALVGSPPRLTNLEFTRFSNL